MMQEPNAVLIVHKHAGVTTHNIVGAVRRLYNTRRVGHAGTLDPMATGVLVVLVGRAAKASEYLSHDNKHYRATLKLGLTTDTEDTTGTVLTTSEAIPTNEELQAILPRFRGEILQTPPMYSALKVDGQKLVDLARRGEVVEREARRIEIFSLEATPTENASEYILDVHCSGGTYIRTLCADIGAALGCGGAMAALERGEACGFDLSMAHTVEEIEAMREEERAALLIPTEKLFANLPEVRLSAFFEKLSRSGCEIYLKKLGLSFPLGTRVSMCDQNGAFFALGEVGEFRDGVAVKAIKMFVL
jgi:tRNA pseudouridine55 synthase